jgi:photosystem II stability/assembly factor-like uncharacterized protein
VVASGAAYAGLFGVDCPTTHVCFAVAINNPQFGAGTILASTDGGVTWSRQSYGVSMNLTGISCPAGGRCYAVGEGGTIVATTDGSTWVQQGGFGVTGGKLVSVSCPAAANCYAVGMDATGSASILASAHGGHPWEAQRAGTGAALVAVSCATTAVCFAATADSILRTTDAGADWTQQPGSPSGSPDAVACPAISTCFVVGAEQVDGPTAPLVGDIQVTIDSGQTLTEQFHGGGVLHSVSCPDIDTCYAVGEGGSIVASVDGRSWSPQSAGSTANLMGVSCPTDTTCYAVGIAADYSEGTILATGDGGHTWTQQAAIAGTLLEGVGCASASMCMAVGDGGAILATVDGGHTWTRQVSGTAGTLYDVSCPDSSTCYAVGSNGTILSTARPGLSQGMPVAVQAGWNMIALPLVPSGTEMASDVLQGVLSGGAHLAAIYGLNNGQWSSALIARSGTAPTSGDFALQVGSGYLLYVDRASSFSVSGAAPSAAPTWTLSRGWNLVGQSQPPAGAATPTAVAALQRVLSGGSSIAAIYGLSHGQWSPSLIAHAGSMPTRGDFTLQVGSGYLLYTDQPLSIGTGAVRQLQPRAGQAGSAAPPQFPRVPALH